MPSLGSFDPLSLVTADKSMVNRYREMSESVVQLDQGKVQFDPLSKHRWQSVITQLAGGQPVDWYDVNGVAIPCTKESLALMYLEAERRHGVNTVANFQVAHSLKERIANGERLTEKHVRDASWSV